MPEAPVRAVRQPTSGQRSARVRAVRDQARHRRSGRDARARAGVPARRRSSPARGRARSREDPDHQDHRRRSRRHLPARAVHARPRAVAISSAPASTARRRGRSTPSSARCSATSCSRTRSTAHPPRCSRRCSRSMQERQVTIGGETHPVPAAVPRDGDAEPDRAGGHLPAARGAGRPLHAQGRRRLPVGGRGADDRPALARPRPPTSTRVLDIEQLAALQAATRRGLRRPGRVALRGQPRRRDPRPGQGRPARVGRPTSPTARARAGRSACCTAPARSPLLRGRHYVLPQDVRELAPDALRHRLVHELPGARRGRHRRSDHPARARLDPDAPPRLARQAVA